MAQRSLTSLFSSRLGNRRFRQGMLGVASFPGLSIDEVPSTPSIGPSISGALPGTTSSSATADIGQQVAALSSQLGDLKTAQQAQVNQILANTPTSNSTTSTSTGSSIGSTVEGAASSLLGGVFGLAPIFQGLMSLFGGGTTQPQSPTPFSLPTSIQYAAGIHGPGGGAVALDYGQGGQLRPVASQPAAVSQTPSQSSTPIQINVNAIDSQSFMDHSEDIAQAVRTSLLNSSSLADVIRDL